jgi:hypothetical protein
MELAYLAVTSEVEFGGLDDSRSNPCRFCWADLTGLAPVAK